MDANNPIRFGKYEIPDPCPVPESELRAHGTRKAFCDRCQAAVHDISGMEPAELDALWERNGGKVCVSFYQHRPPSARNRGPQWRLPSWWRGAAVAAGLSLVILPTYAGRAIAPNPIAATATLGTNDSKGGPHASAPMLISSVVLNQYGENISDDITVTLDLPGGGSHVIVTSGGFFSLDLSSLCQPDDIVTIIIDEQKFADDSGTRSYPKSKTKVVAGQAQNASIGLWVVYTYNHKNRGAVIRR